MVTWSTEEEQSFTRLMEAGRLMRPEAIRLSRRCRDNLGRAMAIRRHGSSEGGRNRPPCRVWGNCP